MIAWWWLLVLFAALTAAAAALDDRVRESVVILLCGAVGVVLAPLVWLVTTVDVGVTPLSPQALARFADLRVKGTNRPAWVFHVRRRGVVILRQWDLGDPSRRVELDTRWRGPVEVSDETQ